MIIGLAGKSGSGKNLLAEYLETKGFHHIDLDLRVHSLLNEVRKPLEEAFGKEIFKPSGEVDRAALGRMVFQDRKKKERLQLLLYPLLEKEVKDAAEEGDDLAVNGALLSESRIPELCHLVFWTQSPFLTRLKRLKKRDNRSFSDLILRMRGQKGLKPQLFFGRVDIQIIRNRGKAENMYSQVDRILEFSA